MPQTAGQIVRTGRIGGNMAADFGEIEGWQRESMPNKLSSLVFEKLSDDDSLLPSACMEERKEK